MDSELAHQPEMEVILSVEDLISRLLSSSKEKQSEGESSFNVMKEKDPNSLALDLADFLGSSSHDFDFRGRCADLLHRLLTDDDGHIWKNVLTMPTQFTIKSILLIRIKLEQSKLVHKLCYTVSKLCNMIVFPSNSWPELPPFLHECVSSNSNRLKKSFFLIFAHLSQDVWVTFVPDVIILHTLFLRTLNDDSLDLELRIAALIAAINFIQCSSSLHEVKQRQNLLPAMIRVLTDALSNGDGDVAAQYVLEYYIKLAKNEPRFFKIELVDVVNTMLEIAEDMILEERTRHLALEFLLTLVEAREKAPGMMKKLPLFTYRYFALLLNLLLDIKDEPSWHSSKNYLDQAGETENYKFSRVRLERFSNALGGKTVAPIAIEQLSPYMAAAEWEKRHAALIALTFIAHGSSKGMIRYLERVVSMVLRSFQDSHPRVRWAAIRSVAVLLNIYCPNLQERHHNQVVSALAVAMDDFQNPRVQALAAIALMEFCKSEKRETLVPYLDGILKKLFVLIRNDNQMVQQHAVFALAAVAKLSEEHFRKYYDFVMPYLKAILVNTNDKSHQHLRSEALECIIMVGTAVGREKFRDDVKQVMEVLKSSHESHMNDFGTIAYILRAWVTICKCMGKDFLPYMSTVMPFFVKCAQLEANEIIVESDDRFRIVHKVKFGDAIIYTLGDHCLEVKCIACGYFGLYADMLEEDFNPWVLQVTSILVPLLKFYLYDRVRECASSALSLLLKSAKLAVEKGCVGGNGSYLKQLSCDIILALGDSLYSEPNTKICMFKLRALNSCLQICGPLLNEDQVSSIINMIKHVIEESSHRRGELVEREKSEDFDAEEAELLMGEREKEVKIFEYVGHILITLIKQLKAAFLPFFDELSSYLMPMSGKDKAASERAILFCIFDMLLETCGEAGLKYHKIFLPLFLESSNDENPDVRQDALYGLGLCAEYGVSIFKQHVGEALPRINDVITHLYAREPENERAYDNAVCALGKICQFHQEIINLAQIVPDWLNCLPIKRDMIEAKVVHDQLCSMFERSDGELLGPKYEHFPKVMLVFAEVLCAGTDLATDETTKRMINVLRNLQKIIPPALWASTWSLLLPQQEMELEFVLSPEKDDILPSVQ